MEQMAMTSLDEKIAARSGRLQLIVAAMSRIAYSLEQDDDPDMDALSIELVKMADEYGHRWLDECADLLKTMYNRRSGP
jgi:hypothetical protein